MMLSIVKWVLGLIISIELAYLADRFAMPGSLKHFGVFALLATPLLVLQILSEGK